jgi:Trypsin
MIEALYSACLITTVHTDEYNKSYTGFATGFFVSNRFNEVCFITNRHVFQADYKEETAKKKNWKLNSLTLEFKSTDTNGQPKIQNKAVLNIFDKVIFSDNQDNDIACIINPVMDIWDSENTDVNFYIRHSLIANASRLSEKLEVCDSIAFAGFPKWYNQTNKSPIFRMGTIASDPRINYSLDNIRGDVICYEGFSYSGNSGGPVFSRNKGIKIGANTSLNYNPAMLIGINAGHIEELGNRKIELNHVGLSYFYKSSAILDLIDKINWLVVI